MSDEDRILVQSVARVIITDTRGTLAEQVNRRSAAEVRVPRFTPTKAYKPESPITSEAASGELILANGIGGFAPDGSEYVITTSSEQMTPAP
jgi:cellobiose phosphorylase